MRISVLCVVLSFSVIVSSVCGQQTSPADLAGLHGGLVVQLGAGDLTAATEMSVTGRYLVHVVDRDAAAVQAAQVHLRKEGHYGLAWAETAAHAERLPYAENMVNLLIVRDYTVSVAELHRALVPGGVIVVSPKLLSPAALQAGGFTIVSATGSRIVARKPWPKEMDVWSHPRHAADGNAVSNDTAVGPPDRVRWIAAATSEVEGMVSAGGRNFYGGVLARDSFNGLRLWHRRLAKKEDNNPVDFSLPRLARDGVRPVASQQSLFAMLGDRLMALDAKTGELQIEFGDMVNPTFTLHDGVRVVAADRDSIRAFSTETGKELWKLAVPDPRHIVGDSELVTFIKGRKRGDKAEAVALDAKSGAIKWQRHDHPWLSSVVRTVLSNGMLAYEISSLNDHDAGNAIHIVSAATGDHSWSKAFPPGMNHRRQARAMFLNDDIWILHGGKINTGDKATLERMPTQVSALNPQTGKTRVTYPAGMAHCFPPVATQNYMFAGVLNLTDLSSGKVIANRITKANCSSENGWVPANGLVYTTPKHCTCWPMLRGFVAMAPAIKAGESIANRPLDEIAFQLEKGPARADAKASNPQASDWPQYRHYKWRSGSSTADGPNQLKQLWSVSLESFHRNQRTGAILHDWQENPVVKGPLSAPTVANGIASVTRPDAHEVVAVGSESGQIRWRFTANGRVDTPPTIHRGLCLFGTAAGWVYALRADSGQVVWRLRAAPTNQRIVAYGQVESPWPVPGSVLVMDEVAYFAAGRQPLADGGIIVFAVNPLTGERHWVKRINTVPQKGFYENSGLEFDPTDLLHAEGDGLAMSRWVLTRDGKDVTVDKWSGFAKLSAGTGAVWIPRGSWTYGARHQHRFAGEASRRPLVVFRDESAFSSLNGSTELFRRRFDSANGETFNSKWITGWAAAQASRNNEKPYRTYRLAEGAEWSVDPFTAPSPEMKERRGAQQYNRLHAIVLDGGGKLFVAHEDGRLKVISTADGSTMTEASIPTPSWDGLAIAEKRLFLSTQDGRLICYGEREVD